MVGAGCGGCRENLYRKSANRDGISLRPSNPAAMRCLRNRPWCDGPPCGRQGNRRVARPGVLASRTCARGVRTCLLLPAAMPSPVAAGAPRRPWPLRPWRRWRRRCRTARGRGSRRYCRPCRGPAPNPVHARPGATGGPGRSPLAGRRHAVAPRRAGRAAAWPWRPPGAPAAAPASRPGGRPAAWWRCPGGRPGVRRCRTAAAAPCPRRPLRCPRGRSVSPVLRVRWPSRAAAWRSSCRARVAS